MKKWIDRFGFRFGFGFQFLVIFAFMVVAVLGFIVGLGPAATWGDGRAEGLKNPEWLSASDRLYAFADEITPDRLRTTLFVLADDSMAGRETGTPAEWKAVEMIASHYLDAGIDPCANLDEDAGLLDFLQPYPLQALRRDSLVYEVQFGDKVVRSTESGRSSADFTRTFGGAEVLDAPIEFAGFGLYDPDRGIRHWEKNSAKKRFVLIFDEVPDFTPSPSSTPPSTTSTPHSTTSTPVAKPITERMRDGTLLRDPGIAGILKITSADPAKYEAKDQENRLTFNKPENIQPANESSNNLSTRFSGYVGSVHPEMAAKLLGLSSTAELETIRKQITQNPNDFTSRQTGVSLSYQPFERIAPFTSHNIAACLEGADPELRDETVVIMAHLDHIGIGSPDLDGDRIYNGADDNGSGTSALMTIAQIFQQAADEGVRPRRSLLFLHVSGEEKGLLGSRYYSNHPVIPIERTTTAFNIDMIGRSDSKHLQQGVTEYVYLIGGDIISSELDRMVVTANEKTSHYLLDRGYNDLNDPNQFYRRSDHWNFGRFGVPFVFFFTGVHEDYHQPGDHAEKIDFEKLAGVSKIIFGSVIEAANSDTKPQVDNQAFIEATNGRR